MCFFMAMGKRKLKEHDDSVVVGMVVPKANLGGDIALEIYDGFHSLPSLV